MSQAIIISILFCCLNISAMHKNIFSITSADGIEFPIKNTHAKQMKIFYPIYPENNSFRSEHAASALRFFMDVVDGIEQGTIKSSSFQTRYIISACRSKIPLSCYHEFDLGLKGRRENKVATLLMSMARELKAEQLAVLFVSLLSEENNHHTMFSALMARSQATSFQNKIDKICKNTYESQSKQDRDHQDELAVVHKANRTVTANTNPTLVAMVDKKDKGLVTIQNKPGSIIQRLSKEGWPLSCVTFSNDGSLFACVNNCKGSYRNGFILFVWDVVTWDLIIDVRYLLSGNIHNICFNHDGTQLVASVESKQPLFPAGSTREYEIIVIDIRDGDTEIIYRIPTHGIAQRMYWRLDNAFVTSFERKGDIFDQWTFKKRNEKAGKNLNFIQRIFLYGLYERIQDEKRSYGYKRKQFIAPLISGYVKKYVMKSLPKRLRVWAQEVQKKYRFQ